MHSGRFVFSQVMDHLPMKTFRRCVQRYQGNRHVQSFTCFDQFLCMAFAQLTFRESLRDIEACLRAHEDKLYHMGIRGGMSRNTLANANRRRDWRIYAEFAQAMIRIARPLYADEDLGLELDNTVYALDASTIDLCLSVIPWALFRSTKSAVKLHTLLDLRGNIPTFIHVSDGKMHDVNVLDILEPAAQYCWPRSQREQISTWRRHRAHRNIRASSIAPPGGEGWTIRDHRAILRSEPYASADLGAASDVTAKSILSEAAPVSPTPAISPQRHSAVIAPAHGDGTPDRQYRFRWEARPGRGRRDDSVRARSPFADHVKT